MSFLLRVASLEIRNLRLSLGMLASFVGVLWAAPHRSKAIRLLPAWPSAAAHPFRMPARGGAIE